MAPQPPLGKHIHRHISAARAFHTDLIAETQRRLRLLTNLTRHLSILRSRESTLTERLSAAESSRHELERLDQLRHSSISTHRDLRNAIRRIHHHLNKLIAGKREGPLRQSPNPSEAADVSGTR
jgi:DNA repair exonuclease SbcCD ATPase subunit